MILALKRRPFDSPGRKAWGGRMAIYTLKP
jgi:hypothetical protein